MSVPLESVYLFQEIGEQSRREIARIASDEQYSQGTYLFHAGDAADCLYILVRGSVRLAVARRGLLSYVVGDFGEADRLVEHGGQRRLHGFGGVPGPRHRHEDRGSRRSTAFWRPTRLAAWLFTGVSQA